MKLKETESSLPHSASANPCSFKVCGHTQGDPVVCTGAECMAAAAGGNGVADGPVCPPVDVDCEACD